MRIWGLLARTTRIGRESQASGGLDGPCELAHDLPYDPPIIHDAAAQSDNVLVNHGRVQRRFLTLALFSAEQRQRKKIAPFALFFVVEERARCMTLISLANRSTFARLGSPYPLVRVEDGGHWRELSSSVRITVCADQ